MSKVFTFERPKSNAKQVSTKEWNIPDVTVHQNTVLTELLNSDSLICRLVGGAGVGKSHTISAFITYCLRNKLSIALTGTTHASVAVLQSMVPNQYHGLVEAATVHSYLGMRLVSDGSGGDKLVKLANARPRPPVQYLVCDECYTGDMEVMTDKGFVRFDSLDKTERIAQYSEITGEISYVIPVRYVEKQYSGEMVTFSSENNIDCTVTAGHDMLIHDRLNDTFTKVRATDVKSNECAIKVAGIGTGYSTALTLSEKLAITIQAYGNIDPIYGVSSAKAGKVEGRDGLTSNPNNCTVKFALKKQRKKDLFKQEFNSIISTEYEVSKEGFTHYAIQNIPISSISKGFSGIFDITTFSHTKANEFLNFLIDWDGYRAGADSMGYSSTNEENVDFVQQVAILAGRKAKKTKIISNRPRTFSDYFKVSITKKDFISTQSTAGKKTFTVTALPVYCVTVPTGNIIVRRSGNPIIAGNCSMLTTELLVQLKEAEVTHKIILVGDPIQLSLPNSANLDRYPSYELTINMRQNGSMADITDYLQILRDKIECNSTELPCSPPQSDNIIIHTNHCAFMKAYKNSTTESKVVACFMNKTVKSYNTNIKKYVVKSDDIYSIGDIIQPTSPVVIEKMMVVPNRAICVIEDIMDCGDFWSLKTDKGVIDVPKGKTIFNNHLQSLADDKNWREFYATKERFSHVHHLYAATSHSLQGTSVEEVFVDVPDLTHMLGISGVNDYLRILYVAMSRTSKRCHLYIGDGIRNYKCLGDYTPRNMKD